MIGKALLWPALVLAAYSMPAVAQDYGIALLAASGGSDGGGGAKTFSDSNGVRAASLLVESTYGVIPNGKADVSVDLAAGSIRGFAGSYQGFHPAQSYTQAQFHDTLFISKPSAAADEITRLVFSVASVGDFAFASNAENFIGDSAHYFSLGVRASDGQGSSNIFLGQQFDDANGDRSVFASETAQALSSGWEDFRGTFYYDFVGSFAQLDFSVLQALRATGGNSGDFSHTAFINFAPPSGVAFSSASSVFLTQQIGAVPETATWLMMIAGLALIGGVLRRGEIRARGGLA